MFHFSYVPPYIKQDRIISCQHCSIMPRDTADRCRNAKTHMDSRTHMYSDLSTRANTCSSKICWMVYIFYSDWCFCAVSGSELTSVNIQSCRVMNINISYIIVSRYHEINSVNCKRKSIHYTKWRLSN